MAHGRHAAILAALRHNGAVAVAEIAAQLRVSDMTIRRDLIELERDGHLIRIHGGAVPAAAGVAMDREEPRFEARLAQRRGAKERIAAAAAALCAGHRSIALDVGTTTYLLAEHLAGRPHVKVFTNSLRAAVRLGEGQAEVYVAGGRVRGEELSIGGPAAIGQFGELWFDVAFIGVSGLTSDGLFDYAFEDAALKQLYLKRSALKVALCDASKFQRMSLVLVASLQDVDVLITDAAPPPEVAAALAAAGVDVQIAPPRG
jgi:DeoR/GlpR family transcriptional regulator of sugar metabolism